MNTVPGCYSDLLDFHIEKEIDNCPTTRADRCDLPLLNASRTRIVYILESRYLTTVLLCYCVCVYLYPTQTVNRRFISDPIQDS